MRKIAFLITLALCLLVLPNVSGQISDQENYYLQLHGVTWLSPSINVLIIPADGEAWWNPIYINSTLRAIGEWNNALVTFAANYSDFEYLSRVRLIPTISNRTLDGYDIFISWNEAPLNAAGSEIGLASITSRAAKTIVNCTITLCSKNTLGHILSQIDMQNIALHELGHGLGLRHSNYTGDLMYPTYALGTPILAISTLDTYGVSRIFQWIPNPSQFYPVNRWLNELSITLPQNIEYEYLPISEEYLPPPQSVFEPILNPLQTILSYLVEFVLKPEILGTIIVAIAGLVMVVLITRKLKKEQTNTVNSNQIE